MHFKYINNITRIYTQDQQRINQALKIPCRQSEINLRAIKRFEDKDSFFCFNIVQRVKSLKPKLRPPKNLFFGKLQNFSKS